MRVIGLTGGVGSGKSSILKYLEQDYNAEIIQADQIAKDIMEYGQIGYEMLREVFGKSILKEDESTLSAERSDGDLPIDRQKMSDMMFHDKNMLQMVNNIIHPLVWQMIKDRIHQSEADLIVVESAIVDKNTSDIYEELWYVYTSEENRLQRLEQHRGYTREKSLSIMSSQLTENMFRSMADFIIDNNHSVEETKKQIDGKMR